MTHSPDDLVARLRMRKPGFELSRYGHVNPDGPEAADRIEQQEEALEAIAARAPERDPKWAGMTARDIALAALSQQEQ